MITNTQEEVFDPSQILLHPDVTYRFTVRGETLIVCVDTSDGGDTNCASRGPLFVNVDDPGKTVSLRDEEGNSIELQSAAKTRGSLDGTDKNAADGTGPKPGLIAGVVVAVAAAVLLGAVLYFRKRKANDAKSSLNNSSAMESSSQGSNDAVP